MVVWTWKSKDDEKRLLRVKVATLERAHAWQKEKSKRLELENKRLAKNLRENQAMVVLLKQDLRKIEKQRDRYRNMVFKKNIDPEEKPASQPDPTPAMKEIKTKKTNRPGAQPGHKGHGRKKPKQADEVKLVYLTHCPDCGGKLLRSNEIHSHTVEDVPDFEKSQVKTTRYDQEWQWCHKCGKKVRAQPKGVVPYCRLGINILLMVLMQKYGAKNSWETILFNLRIIYGLTVSKGALVNMVHRTRQWLGADYNALLDQIRGSPVKHADETSWRVNGSNHWLWGFFTPKCAYYTIEESRGGGIPQSILDGSHENDVLVRDDYAAYAKLQLRQQSCWSHLLRKSREAAEDCQASQEAKDLHILLKTFFADLQDILAQPYHKGKRQISYDIFKQKIANIIHTSYHNQDVRGIQVRIANQNNNLITAILHPNVPLTNNLAERQLRPMVITRKISGGSRSWEGAKTHAVNMSVFQTIRMQNQPIFPTLKNLILKSSLL